MNKHKKHPSRIHQGLLAASNSAVGFAAPHLIGALKPGELIKASSFQLDRTDVAVNSAITSFKVVKEAAEALPQFGGPIKATCGVMILVLGTLKACKDNREGWREIAEIMQDKNQRVISLLELYAQAPEKYKNVLEQANKYQRILNEIASDMKKETENDSEKCSTLESYWEKMKSLGREAALSGINAQKISGYRERLRDQALSTTEVIGMQMIGDVNHIRKVLDEQVYSKPLPSRKVNFKPRPPLVNGFVGRDDILEAMRRTHFESTVLRQNTPKITVLTGLGGSGKTQIALKFASEFEEKYTDEPVYFLDASSQATLETDLKSLVHPESDTDMDALVWLANMKRSWLVILDNADDPSLDLVKFLPRCTHGHIIITTRNRLHKLLAPKATYHVNSLSLEDSIALLLETSGYEDNEVNRQLSEKITQELGCLPLALAHAGAYILLRQCLNTYLNTYRESHSELLGRKFGLLHDYPHSVAATIEMSFQKLSPRVQDLLGLLSHLDARSIPRGIIETAARQRFESIILGDKLVTHSETTQYIGVLQSIMLPQGVWSSLDFDDLIEECEKYSLIQSSTQDGEKFYSMHVLVQVFLKASRGVVQGHPSRQLAARLLGSAITIGDKYEYFTFNRSLSSHIRVVMLDDVIEARDHYGFGVVLEEVGEGQLAVSHMERCLDIWRGSLDEDSTVVMDTMELLARSYSAAGNGEGALSLREVVLEKQRRLVGDDHPKTLTAIHNLALSYSSLRRFEEAFPLNKEVVEKRRILLGDDHIHTLDSINNLANSYTNLGRNEESLPLRNEVLEQRRKLLGDDHLDTIEAIYNLSISYSRLGRDEEALPLKEEVVQKRRRLLGEHHRQTVVAIGNLVISYLGLGRDEEALPLEEELVGKWRIMLGPDHPDTLWAIIKLATTYSNLGLHEKAVTLKEDVVVESQRLLGDDYPDTLIAQNDLAYSYLKLGRVEKALPLAECAVQGLTSLLGEDQSDSLDAMNTLAQVYVALGRFTEALPFAELVVEKLAPHFGEDPADTLKAVDTLANVYAGLGRDEDSLNLRNLISIKQSNSREE
ncbi:TPR-like protein [Serendipita vermifera]|nr:TPR-like protein [Serendipita vermifera]